MQIKQHQGIWHVALWDGAELNLAQLILGQGAADDASAGNPAQER
jgi:hypothetical protein